MHEDTMQGFVNVPCRHQGRPCRVGRAETDGCRLPCRVCGRIQQLGTFQSMTVSCEAPRQSSCLQQAYFQVQQHVSVSELHSSQMLACPDLCCNMCAGDHDDRVVPLHTHKLLATLQHTLAGGGEESLQRNPLLARYETKAGHGAGKPTEKIIAEYADIFGFAAAITSAEWSA